MSENSFIKRIARGYRDCNIPLLANGLVYSTLLALIPCLAILWFFFGRLGVMDQFIIILDRFLESTFGEDVGNKLEQYIQAFTNNALGLGITGIISFLVTFLILVDKIWRSFNTVFEGETSSAPKRYRNYTLLFIIGIASAFVFFFIKSRFSTWFVNLRKLPEITFLEKALREFVPYIIVFVLCFLSYNFMHNNRCIPISSLIGSGISTVLVFVLTKAFGYVVRFSVKNSIIYGSLASILFFLMFMSWIWQIILIGALISYTLSTSHAFESKQEKNSF